MSFPPSFSRAIALAVGCSIPLFTAEELVVTAPATPPLDPSQYRRASSVDTADYLRALPGVDGTRFGGFATDPVIRGQYHSGLSIRVGDGQITSACPNRMDPPTSHIDPALSDAIIVERGVRSLRWGLPGPGGTVRIERRAGLPGTSDRATGRIGTSWRENGNQFTGFADVSAGAEDWALRFTGSVAEADDYRDGDDRVVRSGYRAAQGGLTLTWQATDDLLVEASADVGRHDDVRLAGAPMDSIFADRMAGSLALTWSLDLGPLRSMRASIAINDLEHEMNNWQLRPLTAAMMLSTPTATTTTVARLEAELGGEDWAAWLGADGQHSSQEAVRRRSASAAITPALNAATAGTGLSAAVVQQAFDVLAMGNDLTVRQATIWPDVDTDQWGLYAEGRWTIVDDVGLTGGMRIDHWRQVANDALVDDLPADGNLPDEYWRIWYSGAGAGDRSEWLWSGFLRADVELGFGLTPWLGVATTHRPPDATESYNAAVLPMSRMRWIGNGALEPEAHRIVEGGVAWESRVGDWSWRLEAEAWYDDVSNHILRDRANGIEILLGADTMRASMAIAGSALDQVPNDPLSLTNQWARSLLDSRIRSQVMMQPTLARLLEFEIRDPTLSTGATPRGDGAQVYRNVDAELMGALLAVELVFEVVPWNDAVVLSAHGDWTRGQNSTDDRPLSRIAPAGGRMELTYEAETWSAGFSAEGQLRQDRVDGTAWNASGLDAGVTPAWGIMGLHGSITPVPALTIRAGVDNLFDRTYAHHVTRPSLYDEASTRINEPGRSLWLAGEWSF